MPPSLECLGRNIMNPIRKGLAIGVILLFIGLAFTPSINANISKDDFVEKTTASFDGNTLYVGGSGPGNYTNIQDAIDNSSDGDTVFVYNGTYHESVKINKSIDLIGENRSSTIIEGDYYSYIVTISADYVLFQNFTLENLSGYYSGIYLSSNYSIIRNNTINSENECSWYAFFEGIALDHSNNNILLGNNITIKCYSSMGECNTVGLFLSYSNNNTIIYNNISNNTVDYHMFSGFGYGIYLYVSSNNTINNNIISNNDIGIDVLYSCMYNNISGNSIFKNNKFAIVIYESDNNYISNNCFSHNDRYGVYLDKSSRVNIFNNCFIDDGIFVEDSYLNYIENNTVNGRPLVFLANESGCILTEAGQVVLINCSNITLHNLNLTFTSVSIELWNTDNCTISNNNCSNSSYGIYLKNSNDNTLQNNIHLNMLYGLYLINTQENKIINNSIKNSSVGIIYSNSKDSIIDGNDISNNGNAISFGGYSGPGCKNISISNNNIHSNYYMDGAIILTNSIFFNITNNTISNNNNGIYASDFTSHIIIKDNVISNNSGEYRGNGVLCWGSHNISVISNKINSNQGYGILLQTGKNHNVFNNTLSKNGLVVYHANDNNVENNTVNGKPLVYLESKSDFLITEAGQVVLISCENISVINQNLSNANIGIVYRKCNNCSSVNNKCSDGDSGLLIYESSNINISKNNISNNSGDGIFIDDCYNINILNCNIKENVKGVRLGFTDFSKIIGNNITNNIEYGLDFYYYCDNNTIFHNSLINNGLNVDCCNQGYDNIWDNGYPSGGNYWDDYNGEDEDEDGIGDTPYYISANDVDRYPLMYPLFNNPPDAPIIDGPIKGKAGYQYTYNFSLFDSNGDLVYLRIDWGNGTSGSWQGPFDSKTLVSLNHTWNQKGKFIIRAQTKDIFGVKSNWSEFKISMPKNQTFDLISEQNKLFFALTVLDENVINQNPEKEPYDIGV